MSPATTIVHAGAIIDGTGGPAARELSIRIDGDRITQVGSRRDVESNLPPSARVLDLKDSTLIPGLVDAHVHVTCPPADTCYVPLSAQGDHAQRLEYASRSALAALHAGVTSQRDCGCPDLLSLELRDRIAAGEIQGPRLVACGTAVTTTAGHGHWIGTTADSDVEVRKAVRSLCQAGADFIKVMASGGDMTPRSNRRAPQYSDPEFRAAVDDAHRLQMPVVAHCNPTTAMRQAAMLGVDTIAHCNWLGAEDGTISYDPEVAELILLRGLFLDLNIAGTLNAYVTGDGFAMPRDFPFANRWELHGDLRSRGARILLTSDEFGVQTAWFPVLVGRVIAETGLSSAEAIHRSTLLPAMALRMSDDIGSIAVGKKADLVALTGDLESEPDALARANCVIKNGELIVHGKDA